MKKALIFIFLLLGLAVGNLTAQTVHITRTGTKYHRADCKYLKKSDTPIELREALSVGYEPCKVCKPAQSTTIPEKKAEHRTAGSTQEPAASVQCSGTTQKGARCKRITRSGNGLCWQHGG